MKALRDWAYLTYQCAKNMLDFGIPGDACNRWKGLNLLARGHWFVGSIQIPDEYFRWSGARRNQISLKGIYINSWNIARVTCRRVEYRITAT